MASVARCEPSIASDIGFENREQSPLKRTPPGRLVAAALARPSRGPSGSGPQRYWLRLALTDAAMDALEASLRAEMARALDLGEARRARLSEAARRAIAGVRPRPLCVGRPGARRVRFSTLARSRRDGWAETAAEWSRPPKLFAPCGAPGAAADAFGSGACVEVGFTAHPTFAAATGGVGLSLSLETVRLLERGDGEE